MEMMIATLIVVFLLSGGSAAWSDDKPCLKSLKNSVEDPDGRLKHWNFSNTTLGFTCDFVGVSCWHDREDRAIGIELPSMGLRGQFPAASLRSCSTLTTLDLSGNEFSGPIPSDIHLILPFLVTLDLSNNYFTGFIPPSIAYCTYLCTLVLGGNGLTGPIPNQITLLPRVKKLDVSDNMLAGPLPTYNPVSLDFYYDNNRGLCGHPLKACHTVPQEAMPLPPFFRGILTGWAVSMALVFSICVYALPERYVHMVAHWIDKKKKKKPQESLLHAQSEMNALKTKKMEKYAARIPFVELKEATSNFSHRNVIGSGRRGKTFKARIQSGWPLAVKCLVDSDERDREIASEILSLGRLRHPRLLPLIGFCTKKNDMYFVYKFMSNGSLYDWLHLRQGNGGIMGYWPLRFKIAIGVAEGLAWLHKSSSLRVVHGDITSKCILLDKHFEPKISNFWEAKFIHSKDSVSGSAFFSSSVWGEFKCDKKDVHLFGIVLLELITGKEPQELICLLRNTSPATLLAHFSLAFELDRSLIGQGFDEEIRQCLQIAKNCVHPNPAKRPSMSQAYATLTALEQIYSSTTISSHRVSI